MKTTHKFLFLIISVITTLILLISCASQPAPVVREERNKQEHRIHRDIPTEIEEVLFIYEEAVRTRNRELLREILTDDSELRYIERLGNRNYMRGFDAVAEFRLMFLNDFGPQEEFNLGEVRDIEGNRIDSIAVGFIFPDGDEWISLDKRNNGWKIFEIIDFINPPGLWVTNRYHALTDYDGNGFLDEEERFELEQFNHLFYEGPHKATNQIDEFFDGNHDDFIDQGEIRRAGEIHFILGPRFSRELFPWEKNHPSPALDLNGDESVTDDELNQVWESMTGGPEISLDREAVINMITGIAFPDAVYQPVPRRVSSILDQLADGNGDGVIDEEEQGMIMEALLPAGNDAVNYLERAIDRGHDGWVDDTDTFLILQDSAMGRGMISAGSEPPYEVRTFLDRLLDSNGNEQVGLDEIENAVLLLAGGVELANTVSPNLKGILDMNRDGRIETWEIEETEGTLLYPRPVDPGSSIDLALDANRDNFIDPHELGITAGVTNKGEIPPFEEQIVIIRRRGDRGMAEDTSGASSTAETKFPAGSEYYNKLGTIQDKKLAVVTLSIGTEKVDQETANGVIVFVENAFVNVGKVKVVDRANIKEIFKVYKFQASGVIDETTAVEIGKLSGADIIVIGSINRVGGIFYLNIKLITVQTAEIIGSSISQAVDATEFLEMANQAVYKLF